MEESKVSLSEKDKKFREFALTGNMWKVIFYVCFPLAIFQSVNHLFNILDTMMASHISAEAVSAVAYLSQIQGIVSAIGGGLAMGSSLKISQAYGAGDYKLVKARLNSLIGMCFVIGAAVALFMPFTPFLLRITGTPESFINIGAKYFNITLIATIISFFNNVYIAIERARGNSKRILRLNMIIITLKLSITAVFIYGLHADITMIAVATVISQCMMLVFAIKNLSNKNDVFGFDIRSISFKKTILGPMINISIPVIIEKVAFAMGKTVINAMSKEYGPLTVGALGISNNISGSATTIHNGFQDGGAAIISQNIGGKRIDRALDAFKKLLIINITTGFIGWVVLTIFIDKISYLFASSVDGVNYAFQETIMRVFVYDSFGSCVPLGINAAVMALLFGFGYTKLTLIINFCRVFVFRIPVLWALQNFTQLGSESVGIVMATSNIAVAILSSIVAFFVLRHVKGHKMNSIEEISVQGEVYEV